MTHRHGFEAVDRLLRDLTKMNAPFGGKLFVCGGDLRRIPPVVRRSRVQAAAAALLNRSQLWSSFKVLHLTHNERLGAANDATTRITSCASVKASKARQTKTPSTRAL
jgi:hypothetical protein